MSSQRTPHPFEADRALCIGSRESTHVGRPCTFIRLVGCHLRCTWCDSTYTFKGGEWWNLDQIMTKVAELGPKVG